MLALISLLHASPVEFFGFGARRMGRAGGGTAIADGPESILSNPASLAGMDHPEVSVGFIYGQTSFRPFPKVYWDTNQDGKISESDTPLDVGPSYDPATGFMIGAALPLGRKISAGFGLYLPTQRLVRLQTFDPQIPTYFLYANRQQRYELGLALGVRPFGGLAFGGGCQMVPLVKFAMAGTLDVTVSGADSNSELGDVVGYSLDVHSMSVDIVPALAPIASLHWDAGEAVPALEGLEVGASYRGEVGLPVDVTIDIQANIKTMDTKDLQEVLLPLILSLQLGLYDHYVPSQFNFGVAYTFSKVFTVSADIRRTGWDRLQLSIGKVTGSTVKGATVDFGENPIADANPYNVTFEPTYAPRLGMDLRVPPFHTPGHFGDVGLRVRGGFGFEPTPLKAQGKDSVLLDSDRIIFAVGLGVDHDNPFWHPEGGSKRLVHWDGFLQYHVLASGELDRPDPGTPTAGYSVDGSPIPIGGNLLVAGAQWSFQY